MRSLRPLLLACTGAAVYARTFGVPFVFDDAHAIVQNLRIREWSTDLLRSDRPLVEVTLALNYALGGLHVFGYHAVNLFLHIACGLLVYDVVRRTFRATATLRGREDDAACFAALVFLVHPLQTESVREDLRQNRIL